jgi:hypothetical protein
MVMPESVDRETQLRGLLEKISAYVEQFHGGSVEFVSFDGTKLRVRLGGACLNCPCSLPPCTDGWKGQSTSSSRMWKSLEKSKYLLRAGSKNIPEIFRGCFPFTGN